MNFLDLFAGIGGFRLGMERAGHKCVGFCEIDKFARSSYKAIHNTEMKWNKAYLRKVTDEELAADKDLLEDDLIWDGEIPNDLYTRIVVIYDYTNWLDNDIRVNLWLDVLLRYYREDMKNDVIYWVELPV